MFLEVRLAWRNVWRNPRRTGLTVAATVFAVVLVMFFVAMAAGVHEKMIEDAVRVSSGHVAVSGKGYRENQTLDEFVSWDGTLARVLDATVGVEGYAPRLVSFGLLSKDSATRGVAVLGVDPGLEPSVSTLADRISVGSFVSDDHPHGIVLGRRLAKNLRAKPGDTLLLYSIAYSQETAYDLFDVVGIVDLPEPNLDRSMAILSLADAQAFFVYGDRVSEVAILASDADRAGPLSDVLRTSLAGKGDEIRTWNQLMPELVQLIFLDDAGMYILLVILVIVVAFGIFNTILMAVLERKRELGVVLALGLRPISVFRIVYLESLMLAVVGLAVGLAIGLPLVLWFEAHPVLLTGKEMVAAMQLFGAEPVITWKLKPLNPIGSTITIIGVSLIAAFYPAVQASRGRPVDVLRSL